MTTPYHADYTYSVLAAIRAGLDMVSIIFFLSLVNNCSARTNYHLVLELINMSMARLTRKSVFWA